MRLVKLAMIWVGHTRTFHRVWPSPTVENLLEPLGADPSAVDHFYYTYPAKQCKRNRANDPPPDYDAEDALEYVRLALKPKRMEVREASQRAEDTVFRVRRKRREQGSDWTNLEALTLQYVRRTEAWEDFVAREPGWRSYDAVVFNRPDVFLYDRIVPPPSFGRDDIHVFTSLGPRKDETGLDDRWALGAPEAVERYMRVGDNIGIMLAVEQRPWCPEENNRLHADRSGLKIVKCRYRGPEWPAGVPCWEAGHVGIARFEENDGRELAVALARAREDRDQK